MQENGSYIVCAGRSEQFDFAQPVGIGMMEVSRNNPFIVHYTLKIMVRLYKNNPQHGINI